MHKARAILERGDIFLLSELQAKKSVYRPISPLID